MEAQKYKRVLIKISGEALAGDKHFGLNFDVCYCGYPERNTGNRFLASIGIDTVRRKEFVQILSFSFCY